MASVHPLNRTRAIRGRRALAAWIADPSDHPGNPELYFDGELSEQRVIRMLADLQHFLRSVGAVPSRLGPLADRADRLYREETSDSERS